MVAGLVRDIRGKSKQFINEVEALLLEYFTRARRGSLAEIAKIEEMI
jgi:hypothetical protein